MPERLTEPQRLLLEHLNGIIFEEGQAILTTDYYWTTRLAELLNFPQARLVDVISDYAKKKQKLSALYTDIDKLWNSSTAKGTLKKLKIFICSPVLKGLPLHW